MNNKVSKMLIEGDRPIVVSPNLAAEIGLERAIVLQQLHFLLRDERNGKVIKGKRWIFNTYEGWVKEHFPWMSVRNLRRVLTYLEDEKAVESCQPEGGISRRKYYRLLVGGTAK